MDKSLSGPESCAICVDDFMGGDRLRLLPCGHYFHLNCIDEWLINHSDLCPLCKNQVPHEEEEGEVPTRVHGPRRSGGGRGLPVNFHDLTLLTEEEEAPRGRRPQNRLLGGERGTGDYGAV